MFIYVTYISHICCKYFIWMLRMMVMVSSVFVSILDARFKCFTCLHMYVASVVFDVSKVDRVLHLLLASVSPLRLLLPCILPRVRRGRSGSRGMAAWSRVRALPFSVTRTRQRYHFVDMLLWPARDRTHVGGPWRQPTYSGIILTVG
jgi:hypothetical protein